MKNLVCFILTIAYLSSNLLAQVKGGKYDKLFDLYAMEKYEDCAYKAENYTMNDKTKRDAEPYLYLAMCYLEISKKDPSDLDQEYKDPLKESLKYASKFIKKDKDSSFYKNNMDFFGKLKEAVIAEAKTYEADSVFNKASATYYRMMKVDENDMNLEFKKGVCDILSKNASGATHISRSVPIIASKYKDSNYKPDLASEPVLIDAFIMYSDYLTSIGKTDSAKSTIIIARDILPKNKDIEKQYKILYGLPIEQEEIVDPSKKMHKVYELNLSEQPKEKINITTTDTVVPTQSPDEKGIIENDVPKNDSEEEEQDEADDSH